MESLGSILGMLNPTVTIPKCPNCGGRLTTTVTIYARQVVAVENMMGTKRTLHHGPVLDTKASMQAEVDANYTGAQVDERDELSCENDCGYWCRPVDLEIG